MPAPANRVEPKPGQESVWDYPRPPRVEAVGRRVTVAFNNVVIADTAAAVRVLETSHPPVFYVPPADVKMDLLARNHHRTFCEYKGRAAYYDLTVDGHTVTDAAWFYPEPVAVFAELRDFLAFYPSKVECRVGGEAVRAQEGDFYGGWITPDVVGPFKGGPGTMGW